MVRSRHHTRTKAQPRLSTVVFNVTQKDNDANVPVVAEGYSMQDEVQQDICCLWQTHAQLKRGGCWVTAQVEDVMMMRMMAKKKVTNERHSINGSPWVVAVFSNCLFWFACSFEINRLINIVSFCFVNYVRCCYFISTNSTNKNLSYNIHCFKGNCCIGGVLEWIYCTVQAWGARWHLVIRSHYHTITHTHKNVKHTVSHIEAFLNRESTHNKEIEGLNLCFDYL